MVQLKDLGMGVGCFVSSYMLIFVMSYVIPLIITVGEGIYNNTDIGEIFWFGSIILWVVIALVLPNYFIYRGLTDPEGDNPFANILIGVLLMIFTLAFIIKFNYAVIILGNLLTDTFIKSLYWVSFVIVYIEMQIVVPLYLIITGTQNAN